MWDYRTLRYMRQLFIVYNGKALIQPHEYDGLLFACSFGFGAAVSTSTLHYGGWSVKNRSTIRKLERTRFVANLTRIVH